jgi:signal transduction histidine kinase
VKGLRDRLLQQAAASRPGSIDPSIAREYYQSVIDSVTSVICTVDRELCITGVNRRWDDFAQANVGAALCGDAVLGIPILSLLTGARRKRWGDACAKLLGGQSPIHLDEIAREGKGPWNNYTLVASPLKDNRGEILGITFVISDITQLKKAEAEMLKRLVEIRGFRRVAHIAGSWFDRRAFHKQVTADIAHLFDARKCVIFRWGERSGHLDAQLPAFGLSSAELTALSLDIGDPGDPSSLWQDLEERDYIMLNEGDDAPRSVARTSARVDKLAAMLAVLRVSGRVHGAVLVAGRDRPFSEQEGQIAAAFAVPIVLAIEDAELNQRLLERGRQLAEARQELDRVAHIAASLRMPLTVIRGYGELLLEGALGTVSQTQRTTINLLVEKARGIADALDQIAPSQFLPDAVRYEAVDLADVVRRMQAKWVRAIVEADQDLDIELTFGGEDQYVTTGDPDLLLGVVDALLGNAVKRGPGGGKIRVSLDDADEILYIKVEGPGGGVVGRQAQQSWESSPQGQQATTISMAEVKRIVEGHGGHVWEEYRPGRGGAFYVVLPRIAGSHSL